MEADHSSYAESRQTVPVTELCHKIMNHILDLSALVIWSWKHNEPENLYFAGVLGGWEGIVAVKAWPSIPNKSSGAESNSKDLALNQCGVSQTIPTKGGWGRATLWVHLCSQEKFKCYSLVLERTSRTHTKWVVLRVNFSCQLNKKFLEI